jgi:hypothetical protein
VFVPPDTRSKWKQNSIPVPSNVCNRQRWSKMLFAADAPAPD